MIAKEINTINPALGKTAIQCSNMLACLKRTYKNIKDHNKKSGNSRKSWLFYEEMGEMFGNRAWVAPKCLAEAGSSGLSSSSSELSYSSLSPSTEPTTKSKRKRKISLEDLMSQTNAHCEEKKLREERKLEMFEKVRQERLTMHNEKIMMQQKLLDLMTRKYSGNNTHDE